MKIRYGFVSNSSSSSFIIGYKFYKAKDPSLKEESSLFTFIMDYDYLFDLFMKEYPNYDISQKGKNFDIDFWYNAIDLKITFKPAENKFIIRSESYVWSDYETIGEVTPIKTLAIWGDEPICEEDINEKIYDYGYEYSDFNTDDFEEEIQDHIQKLEKINAKIIWDVGRC